MASTLTGHKGSEKALTELGRTYFHGSEWDEKTKMIASLPPLILKKWFTSISIRCTLMIHGLNKKGLTMRFLKPILTASITCLALNAHGACRITWVDHDYNIATPPIQKQVCSSTLDLPAINNPGIQPIQQPRIRPIPQPSIPPIGTTRCSLQNVYENGRWVTRRLCR